MKSRSKLHLPETLDQFLALPGPGEQILVSLPTASFAARFILLFVGGHPHPARLHIIQSLPEDRESEGILPRVSENLGTLKSLKDGTLLLRRVSRNLPRNRSLIIDLAQNLPRWLSTPSARLKFLTGSFEQLGKNKRRGIWFVSEELFPPEQISALKDAAEFCMQVRSVDRNHYAQFLSARGHHDPELHLPRLVELGETTVLWSNPLKPSEEAIEPGRALKRLEARLAESERQEQFVFANSPVPQAVFTQRRLLRANEAFYSAFPWVSSETPGKPSPHDFFTKVNGDFLKELFYQPNQPQSSTRRLTQTIKLKGSGGETRRIEVHVVILPEGERNSYHFWFFDVTGHAELLNMAKESEAFYRSLLDSSAGAVALVQGGKFVYVNRGLMEMLGYMVREELVGHDVTEFVPARDKKILGQKTKPGALRGGTVDSFEFVGLRNDKAKVYLQAFAELIKVDGKEATLLYLRDKTGEIEAEEARRQKDREQVALDRITHAIHQSVELLESFSSGLQASVQQLGFDGGGVYSLDEDATGLTLVSHQGLTDRIVETLGKQTIQDGLTGFLSKTLEPIVLSTEDYPPYLPYKSLFEGGGFKTIAYIPLVAWDALAGIMFLSSRRKAENFSFSTDLLPTVARHFGSAVENGRHFERIRSSELRFRSAVETVPAVIYEANPNGTLIFMSPQVEWLVGHKPIEFLRNHDAWRSIVHPDDRAEYSKRVSMQAERVETAALDYRVLPRGKASYRWVRDSIRYLRDESGAVTAIYGTVSDITDQIERMQKASESGSKRDILESVAEGVAVLDNELRYIEWNSTAERMTGMLRDSVIGEKALDGPLAIPDFERHLTKTLAGEETSSRDFDVAGAGTSKRWFWARFSPLRDASGSVAGVVVAITDISDRKNLEDEARESEETLRHVLDGMGDALMITDLEGVVWEVNRVFTDFTGYTKNEVRGTIFPYPWLIEEEMSRFVKWIAELREKGALRDFDMRWLRKDGREIAISLNTTLLRSHQGEPVAMLNIARDISDRRRMSIELAAKTQQVEMLNRIISKANTTVEFQEVFDVIAQEVEPLVPFDQLNVGLLSDDRTRMTLHACMSPAEKTLPVGTTIPVEESVSSLAIKEGRAVIVNDLLHHKGLRSDNIGATQGFRSQMTLPIYFNEQLLGTLNVASTTQNLYQETDLAVLQPIADQIGGMIDRSRLFQRVTDEVKRVTLLYELGKRLTGVKDRKALFDAVYGEVSKAVEYDKFAFDDLSRERGTLQRFYAYPHSGGEAAVGTQEEEISPEEEALLRNLVKSGIGFSGEGEKGEKVLAVPVRSRQEIVGILSLRRKGGEPFTDGHLRILESIGNLTEIALDRVRLYEDILAKSREVEARNKELDDFAYVVSHDLKEPLITIEAYSRILKSEQGEAIGDEGRQYLASLIQSSSRMKSLIDDLLTLSRLGQDAKVEGDVPVGEIVQDVVGELGFTIRQRGALVNVPPGLPSVRFNPTQLGMVFRNLIANSLKFNKSTEPRIDIGWRELEERSGYVFSVSDNGIGIPEEHAERIFGIFQRLHVRDEYPGTGAGLTIVKKIVQNHGGRIWVESVVGKGSTFYFTVPA